jgi:hypothetical protein
LQYRKLTSVIHFFGSVYVKKRTFFTRATQAPDTIVFFVRYLYYIRNMNTIKRILVTGGAGFIGSHLCERLLQTGAEVLCVDNCFCGTKDNISHLLPNPRFEFIRHDVTFPLYVEVKVITMMFWAGPECLVRDICNPLKMVFCTGLSRG